MKSQDMPSDQMYCHLCQVAAPVHLCQDILGLSPMSYFAVYRSENFWNNCATVLALIINIS